MRRYYLDTSAYLCVLLAQPGHETVASEIAGHGLLSSTLLVLEAQRNLIRHAREGQITPVVLQDALDRLRRDLSLFQLRDLTVDLCLSSVMPLVSTPRSPDLGHLRTAQWFHAQQPLDRFVSLDSAQNQAARELGIPV